MRFVKACGVGVAACGADVTVSFSQSPVKLLQACVTNIVTVVCCISCRLLWAAHHYYGT